MTRLTLLLVPCLLAAGCVPGRPPGAEKARPAKQPVRSVSVTIYSVPPDEDVDPPYYYHGNQDKESYLQWKRENLRIAKQVQLFAKRGPDDPSLKPYGFGVVQDERDIVLPAGLSDFRFTDIAVYIKPDSVLFTCLSAPGEVEVLEQNYEYDLISADAVLNKYVDHRIAVIPDAEPPYRVTGRLLCADDDGRAVIETSPGETEIVHCGWMVTILLPEIPEGLITRPRLVWLIEAGKPGKQRVKISYITRGLMWEAGYTALLSSDEKTLALAGVATIGNASGASYENARLKLVAGKLNLVEPMLPLWESGSGFGGMGGGLGVTFGEEDEEGARFREKSFFEYHLYTLGRPCTIMNNEVKQIELFAPAPGIPVRTTYEYCGVDLSDEASCPSFAWEADTRISSNTNVDVYLHFDNEEEAGLGIPLPAGPVQLFKRDPSDGQMELIGHHVLTHTPKDEEVTFRFGSAFDIVGKRTVANFKCDFHVEHWIEETIEITLRSHKNESVVVSVKEVLYRWVNWEMIECSHEYRCSKPLPVTDWRKFVRHVAARDTISFDFQDVPFREALRRFSKLAGVEIVLDPEFDPAVLELPSGLKVTALSPAKALELLLENSGFYCRVKGEGLFISSGRSAAIERRDYDISGRGTPPRRLAEIVQGMIAPETWGVEFGTSLERRDGVLVVSQTPYVHRRIERFLATMSLDYRTIFFTVNVPANGEETITYTVKYTW